MSTKAGQAHWSPRNVPILGPDRLVRYLLHEVADVTKVVKAQAAEQAARSAMAAAEAALAAARTELKEERSITYDLQRHSEQLRDQGEQLRLEIRRLMEHSGVLRAVSRGQRQTRKRGGEPPPTD